MFGADKKKEAKNAHKVLDDNQSDRVTLTLRTNEHFDKFSLKERGLAGKSIHLLKAVSQTKFLRMNVLTYESFASDTERTQDGIEEML